MQIAEAQTSDLSRTNLPFSFTGSGVEYFRIWIVNIVLTILTLGIYSAWAKVRRGRYLYGNTILDDAQFVYLADPKQILRGRLIVVGIAVAYYVAWEFFPGAALLLLAIGCALLPVFIVSSMRFRSRNSAYRHIRFHFITKMREAYRVFLIPLGAMMLITILGYLAMKFGGVFEMMTEMEEVLEKQDLKGEGFMESELVLVSFFLLLLFFIPWLDFLRVRLIVSHAYYGKTPFVFSARLRSFYVLYFYLLLINIGIILLSFFLAFIVFPIPGSTVFFILTFFLLSIFASGFFRALRRNLIYNNTRIGESRLLSRLKAFCIGWISLSNTIVIILTLGLFIPWAKIRMLRYLAQQVALEAVDLDTIRVAQEPDSSALGEEIDEAFDLELGI